MTRRLTRHSSALPAEPTLRRRAKKRNVATRYGRITCELQTQGGGQARWEINTSIVGVVEPLDLLSVTASPSELKLKRGGKAEFTVKIERNEGFKDAVTLDMAFMYFTTKFGEQLPPGVTLAKGSTGRLGGDTLEGKIILEANDKALLVERFPVAALARVPITFSITTNYAQQPDVFDRDGVTYINCCRYLTFFDISLSRRPVSGVS